MTRVAVCRIEEVPADRALCRRLAEGPHVAVARLDGGEPGFVVFENRCPHADGPIGQGRVSKNSIVCPWHFFRFDLATGKPVGMESIMQLRRFPVSISQGSVWIELERDGRTVTEGSSS
jgi:nitrite reductase/ring-hydroxylating ferredoxin subunit